MIDGGREFRRLRTEIWSYAWAFATGQGYWKSRRLPKRRHVHAPCRFEDLFRCVVPRGHGGGARWFQWPLRGLCRRRGDGDATYGRVPLKEGPRVFAAGAMVQDVRYRHTAAPMGDGCRAALDAQGWIEEQDGTGGLRGT